MPVISATWEAEVEGLQFETSPSKKLAKTHFSNKLGVVAHSCNPSYAGGYKSKVSPGAKMLDPI
jgi:hypothetical protein